MTDASAYKKLTPREHILVRPDSYIGSRTALETERWVWNAAEGRMNWRKLMYNPGLFKIFDEIVVNALDHIVRQAGSTEKGSKVSQIVVTLTPTMFRIYNDGAGIPVEMHPEYKVMAPELIFGHLLTSSNYDDAEEKVVGGKNGFGAKLTNIYSTTFILRTCDMSRKFLYEQTFTENMSVIGKPRITKVAASSKPFTEITTYPDLARFYPELGSAASAASSPDIPADMLDVLRTRVVDMAALAAAHGVRVYLAESDADDAAATLIPVASFDAYARLFAEPSVPVFYERCGPRWEVAAVLTRHLHADGLPDDRHISFVNGIFTRRGGKHVDAVSRAVLTAFCEGPGKKFDLKPAQLKDAVTFFVNATIVNPDFESQSKETLTTIASRFGSKFEISDKFVSKLAKEGGLLEEAAAVLDSKLAREAKKVDGKKTASVRGIPKLEDATWAGTAKSGECTLILTEGDSAAALAIAGLAVVGRERYGVFPLRGKPLNVRDASETAKTDNAELTNIKQILGLVHGRKYTDVKTLRYGRVMIMTDQDVDGSHIKGLLVNMFDAEWPELLKLPFLCCMMTPLLKATKGKTVRQFYSASEYDTWLKTAAEAAGGRGWSIKYYKGLGTSTATEGREYFKSMNTVRFLWDETTPDAIDMAFNKTRADDRKDWLETYDRDRTIEVPAGGTDVSLTRFVNDELIHFSVADNHRSIPHLMDGLKPSLRKILWAARKRGLTSEIKVAQLAGYVSEHAAYHHGEASLLGAIIGMAQNFVGSNNVNLLTPSGQFGTRLAGGKDSAAARYIFTALEPIQATLFHKADDPALTWLEDDGSRVEPEYYMPILPLLLINGTEGIGTGHSSSIPCHSPRDVVAALRGRLTGIVEDLTEVKLMPWWDGFRGTVALGPTGKNVITKGVYHFVDDEKCQIRITELPIGVWTTAYKAFLEELLVGEERPRLGGHKKPAAGSAAAKKAAAGGSGRGKKAAIKPAGGAGDAASVASSSARSAPVKILRDYQANYNDVDVDFLLTLDAGAYTEAKLFPSEFEKRFKLTSTCSLSNMVAFNTSGIIQKFGSAGEIMEAFYATRLSGYATRKANEMARLSAEIQELDARVRFVRAVVAGTLKVANAADEELLAGLVGLGLPALSGGDGLRGFEYLLRMRVDRLKASAVAELEAELVAVRAALATLEAKTPEMLWLEDLGAFEAAYEEFEAARAAGRAEAAASSAAAAPSGTKKRGAGGRAKKTAAAT